MKKIFEAHSFAGTQDFDSQSEAKAFVERNGAGHVTTFYRDADGRDRSGALITFNGSEWTGVDISR